MSLNHVFNYCGFHHESIVAILLQHSFNTLLVRVTEYSPGKIFIERRKEREREIDRDRENEI